jgi:hypothetical protein
MIRAHWVGIALALSSLPARAAEPTVPDAGPTLKGRFGEVTLQVPISVTGTVEGIGGYPLDKDGTQFPAGVAVGPRARVGFLLDTGKTWSSVNLLAELEADLVTGFHDLRSPVDGVGMPYSGGLAPAPRKAYVRALIKNSFMVGAGLMTSHWGLGLVANDGNHGWTPGSARFTDPRGGDRVLRAMVSTVPFTSAGLMITAGFDRGFDDAALLTSRELSADGKIASDTAYQAIAAVTFGYKKPTNGGLYGVQRWQTTADGRYLHATVIDATATTTLKLGETSNLSLAAEGAFIAGTTNFAASPEFAEQKVRQLGVAARAGLDFGGVGGVLDLLYASGDQNIDDETQNGFKVNPNYETGLLLFRQVMAAQTGRSATNAGNPELVGYPAQGLERFSTRASPTNTFSVFPRIWWRPVGKLEIYGGALFALSAVPFADPLNSKFAGGAVRNAYNATPGKYLGTEADLGVRYQLPIKKTLLSLGLEGGVLVPGSAFNDASGKPMGNVAGARLMLDYRL